MIKSWRFLLGLVVLSTTIVCNHLVAAENHWIQPNGGEWNNSANWSLGTVPAATDDVIIDEPGTYTIQVESLAVANSVKVGGISTGTKTVVLPVLGSGELAVAIASIETNGVFQFAGGVLGVGDLTIKGLFDWTGGSFNALAFDGTIEPSGTLICTGTDFVVPGVLQNNGIITWRADRISGSENTLLVNEGVFLLEADCSLDSFAGSFVNTGIIKVPENSFRTFHSGLWGFTNQGTFLAEANSVLTLADGDFHFDDGSTFEGPGVVRLGSGNFLGLGTLTANGTVQLDGGNLRGQHIWTGPGQLDWTSGGFNGTGSTTFAAGFDVRIFGMDSKSISDHNVTNEGTVVWSSAGPLDGNEVGGFFNAGTFVLETDCLLGNFSGHFENSGVIRTAENSFATMRSVFWTFDNRGTLLAGANSVLTLEGEFQLNDGSTFEGPGVVRLGSGNFLGLGTLTANGTVQLDGGNLRGQHIWTGPGELNWTSGGFNGTGSTTFAPGFDVRIFGMDPKSINHHNVTNEGTVVWSSAGPLDGNEVGGFFNAGTFVLETDCLLGNFSGHFENSGVIRTAENSFATMRSVFWTFDNRGTLLAGANSVLTLADGDFELNDGSTFEGPGVVRLGSGNFLGIGTLTANGTVQLASGILQGQHIWTGPGELDWTAGGFDGMGSTTFAGGFDVRIFGMDSKSISNHNLTNHGTMTWNSAGALSGGGGGDIHNVGTFLLETDLFASNGSLFRNTGVFASAENSHPLVYAPGNWNFINDGTFRAPTNSTLTIEGGEFHFRDGSTFDGTGFIRFSDGSILCTGTLTVNGTVQLVGSTLHGDHTWTGPGNFDWISGGFEGGGTATLANGLQVTLWGNIYGGNLKYINNYSIVNQTLVRFWEAIVTGSGATIENYGTFSLDTNWSLTGNGMIENHGRIEQSSGTVSISWGFQNTGVLKIEGGAFNLSGAYSATSSAVHEFVIHGRTSELLGHGRLNTSLCDLAGTVSVALGSNFKPHNDETFQLINYSGRAGQFSDVVLPGSSWDHQYQASAFLVIFNGTFAPLITVGPINQTVNPGETVNFLVTASGTDPLSYQWQFESVNIPDATTSVLTLSHVSSTNAGLYTVVVTNGAGSASSSAVLTVRQAPLITTQPLDQTVNLTSNVTFSVVATGHGPLSYQWYFDGAPISGATASSFVRNDVSSTQAGDYYVVVTNIAGIATSEVATLTISYAENPFFKAAGSYNGLFHEAGEIRHESSGYITVKVRTNAAYSGKLLLNGNTVSFSGKFATDGTTNKTVFRTKFNKSALLLNLQVDFGADQFVGTITTTNWVANILADRLLFSATNITTHFSSKYTMLIPGSDDAALSPVGYGYGLITVRTNGKISVNGLLSDRQTAKQSTFVSGSGNWPFFSPLYKGISIFHDGSKWITNKDFKGSIIGWLTVTNAGSNVVNGAVHWTKQTWTNNLYADGFTNESVVAGSVFKPVLKGTRLLSITNGTASFVDGNLPSEVTHEFTLKTNNTFVTSSRTNLTVSMSVSSGVIKGTFRPSAAGTSVPFYGAILQDQNLAGGFFLGTNQSGLMLLEGN